MRKLFSLLFACVLIVAASATDYSDPNFLADKIYREFIQDAPCVLLLTKDGQIGCSFKDNGLAFPLTYLRNAQEVRDFVQHISEEKHAIIVDRTYFTSEFLPLDDPQKASHIGAILIHDNATAPAAHSPAAPYPWKEFSTHPSSNFVWNPVGNSWALKHFPHLPIVLLREDDAQYLIDWLRDKPTQEGYPKWSAEFNYQMWATHDSALCLDRSFCLPLGGQNVWSSFGAVNEKPVLLGIAQLDSAGLFHDRAIGATTAVSGSVAMLAAAHAISQLDPAFVQGLDKQLAFAFFQGESFGYVGSRAFVNDLRNFTCHTPNGGGCADPWRSSVAFEKLKLNNIAAVLEAKQVGTPGAPQNLYVHTEKPASSGTSQVVQALMLNAPAAGVTLRPASAATPGIPPSSLNSFLLVNPSLSGVVITDHEAAYTNPYYDSEWDRRENVDAQRVCHAATLIARTMVDLATSTQGHEDLQADCDLVGALLDCFISNASCQLFSGRVLDANSRVSEFSHYVGVYSSDVIEVSSKAAFELLFNWTSGGAAACNSSVRCAAGLQCYKGTCTSTYYHDAVSPAFQQDMNTYKWKLVDSSHPTFTESYWARLNMRVFQKESPGLEVVIFVFGLLETLLAAAALLWVRPKLGFDIVLHPPRPARGRPQQQSQQQQQQPVRQPVPPQQRPARTDEDDD